MSAALTNRIKAHALVSMHWSTRNSNDIQCRGSVLPAGAQSSVPFVMRHCRVRSHAAAVWPAGGRAKCESQLFSETHFEI